jgi:hypothetical protein
LGGIAFTKFAPTLGLHTNQVLAEWLGRVAVVPARVWHRNQVADL